MSVFSDDESSDSEAEKRRRRGGGGGGGEEETTYQNCCQQDLHSHDHKNANIQRGGEREESIGGNVVCECDSYEEEPEDEEER
jgi:hypothetical protein